MVMLVLIAGLIFPGARGALRAFRAKSAIALWIIGRRVLPDWSKMSPAT
jgi:hypothetical protein